MIVGWETEGGGDEQRDSDEEWSIETSSGWVRQHPASTGDRGELRVVNILLIPDKIWQTAEKIKSRINISIFVQIIIDLIREDDFLWILFPKAELVNYFNDGLIILLIKLLIS